MSFATRTLTIYDLSDELDLITAGDTPGETIERVTGIDCDLYGDDLLDLLAQFGFPSMVAVGFALGLGVAERLLTD